MVNEGELLQAWTWEIYESRGKQKIAGNTKSINLIQYISRLAGLRSGADEIVRPSCLSGKDNFGNDSKFKK